MQLRLASYALVSALAIGVLARLTQHPACIAFSVFWAVLSAIHLAKHWLPEDEA